MASNHSEEQPRNVPNVTIVLGGGNRGRTVHKVKMVHLNSQTAAEEQMKAEQQQKEKIKQQRGMCITLGRCNFSLNTSSYLSWNNA